MLVVPYLAPDLSYQLLIEACSGNKITNFLGNFAQALIIAVPCYLSDINYFLNTPLR